MDRRSAIFLVSALVLGMLGRWPEGTLQAKAVQAGSAERITVWNRVYTEAQAAKGKSIFDEFCSSCHGQYLEGGGQRSPGLRGDKFMESWREDNLGSLFTKIRTTMPRRSTRTMTEDESLALVTHILHENDFPAGTDELSVSMLSTVRIEREDGPQQLPNFSLIQVVGCMARIDDNAWGLSMAGQPTRLRTTEKSTPEELRAAEASPLGTLTFRLQNLLMLGAFKPEDHGGHKMQARGTLIRRGSGIDRISVTELEMVGMNCGR